jgi:hypothetical protein
MLEIRTLNGREFPTNLYAFVHIRVTANGLFLARGTIRTAEGATKDFTPPPTRTLDEAVRDAASWATENETEVVVYLSRTASNAARGTLG